MPIKTLKLGPGELVIGETGAPLDCSSQVTACRIAWSVDTEDDVPVLSGEVLEGDDTFSASLSATFLQDDLAATGLIRYSWTHKGEQVPFRFTPSSAIGAAISGVIKLTPLDVGGDAATKNTSEVEWGCVGEPVIADDV